MVLFLFIFGLLLSDISFLIWTNKTYLPKDPNCQTDVKDAENNMMFMKIFGIAGPVLLLIGVILLICGVGVEF